MPKRISSEFNFAPQLKKRISDIDVKYVYDPQAVYDRTMNLLYHGAKSQPVNEARRSLNSLTTNCYETEYENRFKQTTLNNNCQLELRLLTDQSKQVSLTQFDKCCFCERLSCFTELVECANCHDLFCNNCSFLASDDERSFCLSCFK